MTACEKFTNWGVFAHFDKERSVLLLLLDCEATVPVTLLTLERWRRFEWPWVQSVWRHNKGMPETLLCRGGDCSLDTSYLRNVKAMLLLYFASQESTLHAILFDKLRFEVLGLWLHSWLLLLLLLFQSWLSTGYLTAFQSVLFFFYFWSRKFNYLGKKGRDRLLHFGLNVYQI